MIFGVGVPHSLGQVLLDRKGIASGKIQLKVGHVFVSFIVFFVERIQFSLLLDTVEITR